MSAKPYTLEEWDAADSKPGAGLFIESKRVRATVEALEVVTRERDLADMAYEQAHRDGWVDCEEFMKARVARLREALEAVLPHLLPPDYPHDIHDYDSMAAFETAAIERQASALAYAALKETEP